MGKKGHSGSTFEQIHRGFGGGTRPLGSVLERALLGQMANPPNTAISVPMQQAISGAQLGPAGLAHIFGIGADQSLSPGPNQFGLQSREQLGLPDRRSYFTFLPTADQLSALGAVPGIGVTPEGKRAERQLTRLPGQIEKARSRGKEGRAERLERKEKRISGRHPEI